MADSTWPLVWVADAAGISRGTARGLVRDGLLPAGDLTAVDAIIAKVGAACAAFPAATPDRDEQAVAYTRAVIHDERRTSAVSLVITERSVSLAHDDADLARAVKDFAHGVVVIAPVGAWLDQLDTWITRVLEQRGRTPSPTPQRPTATTGELAILTDEVLGTVSAVPAGAQSLGVQQDANGEAFMVFEELLVPAGAHEAVARKVYRVPLNPMLTGGQP